MRKLIASLFSGINLITGLAVTGVVLTDVFTTMTSSVVAFAIWQIVTTYIVLTLVGMWE